MDQKKEQKKNGVSKDKYNSITLVYKEIEASTKIPVFTEFEGAEFKFEIRFFSSLLVFFRYE